jgi:cytochrome c-type biogenesis protein CcmH
MTTLLDPLERRDFVLFRPPVDERTWALWAAPFLLILAGLAAVFASRRRRGERAVEIAPEEGER